MYTKGHSFPLNDRMQITNRARERYRHAVKCVRYIIQNKTKLGDPPNDYTVTHKNLNCRKQIACRRPLQQHHSSSRPSSISSRNEHDLGGAIALLLKDHRTIIYLL